MSKYNTEGNSKLFSEKNISLNILPHYGLEGCKVEQIKFKNTEKQRAVYRVIQSEANQYSLKKVYYGVGELLFTYSAVQWWHKKGINVPIFIPTMNGGRFVTYNKMLFIMTPWIKGDKLNYDNLQSFLDTATVQGRMHKEGLKFEPIKGSVLKSSSSSPSKSIIKRCSVLLKYYNDALSLDDDFSKKYVESFPSILKLCEMAYKTTSQIDYSKLTKSLCHLDYVNKNILFDKNNRIWVIDFDNCKYTYTGNDLCHTLRRYLKRGNTSWNYKVFKTWLEIYNSEIPLTFDDLQYIFMNLVFPQRIWKLTRDYYKNYRKCNKNSFLKILTDIVSSLENKILFSQEFQLDLSYMVKEFNNSPKFFIDLEI